MRPIAETCVASVNTMPAPPMARAPRCCTCQSSPRPSVALYWHIGATTMRLRAVTERKVIGWNRSGVGMRRSIASVDVGRHALVGQFAPCLVRLVQPEAHAAQHMRRLGELDVAVGHDLHAVAPRIEEIEERPVEQLTARRHDKFAHRGAVIDHQAEMPRAVAMLAADLRQVGELNAHVDEGAGLAL